MEKISKLISLSLLRVTELGQEAFTTHESCMRRGETPDDIETTKCSVKCKTALENQHKWINAIMEALADDKIR